MSPSNGRSTRWLGVLAILPVAAIAVLFLSLQPLWRAYQVEDFVARLDRCDPQECAEEIAGLATMGEDAIGPMAAWIIDPDIIHRRKAALVLSQIFFHGTTESERLRRKVVLVLCQTLSERVSPLLHQALKDEDKYVWEGAPNGLLQLSRHSSDTEIERLFRQEGLALVERGEWKAASAVFDRIIRKDPELPEAYFQRAKSLYHLDEYDGCLRDCQETLRRAPSHSGALVFMGICYHRLGQTAAVRYRINYWKLAYDAFNRASAINPHLDFARECTELYHPILSAVGAFP